MSIFFKQINDTHGHAVGDKVLQLFADKLVENIRTADTAARLGGEAAFSACSSPATKGRVESPRRESERERER